MIFKKICNNYIISVILNFTAVSGSPTKRVTVAPVIIEASHRFGKLYRLRKMEAYMDIGTE